jgi:ABC-type transporter Mla MlaB component
LLRISAENEQDALLLVLEGRLVEPWVNELRDLWRKKADAQPGLPLIVDLCGLTAMDTSGQQLLDELLQRGATLRCSDVMNQFLVEQMSSSTGPLQETCRPCRRFSADSEFPAAPGETELAS